MKIHIHTGRQDSWYKDYVGQEFKVLHKEEGKMSYYLVKREDTSRSWGVEGEDCTEVEE